MQSNGHNTNLSGSFTDQMVGAVVAANYRAADVFTKYGIDYCCGGQISVGQACAEKGLDPAALMDEVAQAAAQGGPVAAYNQWGLDFLADYIVNQHHAYTKTMIPRLAAMMEAVIAAHAESHPELYAIDASWQAVSGELIMHMQKEELMLFPYIKRLVRSSQEGGPLPRPKFGSAAELIELMEDEHQSTGDQLAAIEQGSGGFTPPEDACPTFQALYRYLEEFQAQTKEHVHLENNILFPKAIALEAQQRAHSPA